MALTGRKMMINHMVLGCPLFRHSQIFWDGKPEMANLLFWDVFESRNACHCEPRSAQLSNGLHPYNGNQNHIFVPWNYHPYAWFGGFRNCIPIWNVFFWGSQNDLPAQGIQLRWSTSVPASIPSLVSFVQSRTESYVENEWKWQNQS